MQLPKLTMESLPFKSLSMDFYRSRNVKKIVFHILKIYHCIHLCVAFRTKKNSKHPHPYFQGAHVCCEV